MANSKTTIDSEDSEDEVTAQFEPGESCERCLRHVTTVNVAGNTFLIIVKAYLGIVGGSKALVADAIHSLGDLLASFMMFIALKVADKPRSKDYPYGRGKVEYIAALIISFFLLILGIYIFIDGARDVYLGRYVAPHLVTAWGALISIIVNELMCRQAHCVDVLYNKPSVAAVSLESRVDTYSSAAVLVGIVGAKISLPVLDSIAAIIVAILILKSSADMFLEAVKKLMDYSMDDKTIAEIRKAVAEVSGIKGVKNVRTRELGSTSEVEVAVFVDKDIKVEQFDGIKAGVSRAVRSKLDFECEVTVRLKPFLGNES
ncbi:MAG: cation transporter [Deltaproteobacteria bacterium]|nr:cation transporter [Deltaproteobacteria bacterium]